MFPDMSQSIRPASQRMKLWEIDPQWHCTIIGTCLPMDELASLMAKTGIKPASPNPSDYEIHTVMVHCAVRERRAAKMMHKALDRRHALAVARFSKLKTEAEVELAWKDSLGRGDVAGGCWGAMSHGAVGEGLRNRIFAEIHMLSHQIGASVRADLRKIYTLEAEKAALQKQLARQQDRIRQDREDTARTITELSQRLEVELSESRRLGHAAEAADELERLRALVRESNLRLDQEMERRMAAETEIRSLLARMKTLESESLRHACDLDILRRDNQALEQRLLDKIAPTSELAAQQRGDGVGQCDGGCGNLDLCGRCILYVGGRPQQVPHLRRLVEGCNGTFLHHDGGIEESVSRLPSMLAGADAVLLPTDCTSHAAHDKVKSLCHRWEKPFIPVTRSGLGAFLQALEGVAPSPATVESVQ